MSESWCREPYNFWQDFFDTYQSLSDWIKALWLIVPPTFLLLLLWMGLRARNEHRSVETNVGGRLIYSVYRDNQNRFHVISHQFGTTDDLWLLPVEKADPDPEEIRIERIR